MSSTIDFSSLTFLIADDSRFMRRLVVSALRAFGARMVFEAATGEEAYMAMRQCPCDVVILDWEFPDRSGESVMRQIRQPDHPLAYQTVIMMSGHDEKSWIERALRFGVNGYVAKPVAPATLYAQITQAVVRPRPFLRSKNYFGPQHPLLVADIERQEAEERAQIQKQKAAENARFAAAGGGQAAAMDTADLDDFAVIID